MSKIFVLIAAAVFFLSGCTDNNSVEPLDSNSGTALNKSYKLTGPVFYELQAVKAATAKYNDINRAIADGYADINVVVPHMGHHYLKAAYMDANFELTKPEILVYQPRGNGTFKLVAVEYAVPLNLASAPPEGFTGSDDVWHANTGAGIWALHAWIWEYNPDGVFADFNPDVP